MTIKNTNETDNLEPPPSKNKETYQQEPIPTAPPKVRHAKPGDPPAEVPTHPYRDDL